MVLTEQLISNLYVVLLEHAMHLENCSRQTFIELGIMARASGAFLVYIPVLHIQVVVLLQ